MKWFPIKRWTALLSWAALAAPLGEDHIVVQKDRAFAVSQISVKAGDTITFVNQDEVVHNVFSISPGLSFDIKRQAPGGQSTVTFEKPGMAEVRCSIHPKMKLIVNVK